MGLLICSGNRLFGECLCYGFSSVSSGLFVKHVATIDAAIETSLNEDITSVLVDISDASLGAAIARLARALPGICILALSVDDQKVEQVVHCARLGYHGIVPRDTALEEVVRIVQAAERGEVALRANVAAQMMRAMAQTPRLASSEILTESLTRREKEVCSLLCEGMTNKEIAREINRSVGTVKNHVRAILTKFDLPRRGAVNTYLGQVQHAAVSVTSRVQA